MQINRVLVPEAFVKHGEEKLNSLPCYDACDKIEMSLFFSAESSARSLESLLVKNAHDHLHDNNQR